MTATPVRRSARHIREKDAPSSIAARMDVLRAVDFAYAPNPMLDVMKDVMAEAMLASEMKTNACACVKR